MHFYCCLMLSNVLLKTSYLNRKLVVTEFVYSHVRYSFTNGHIHSMWYMFRVTGQLRAIIYKPASYAAREFGDREGKGGLR